MAAKRSRSRFKTRSVAGKASGGTTPFAPGGGERAKNCRKNCMSVRGDALAAALENCGPAADAALDAALERYLASAADNLEQLLAEPMDDAELERLIRGAGYFSDAPKKRPTMATSDDPLRLQPLAAALRSAGYQARGADYQLAIRLVHADRLPTVRRFGSFFVDPRHVGILLRSIRNKGRKH